ncbi:DsbA family oxidoreductase [Spirilliplanes yamanashiensis]|uniref:DsbA family oxidoreductase n=1 Tax=Spirilliplanes yamanashiensis TaxID=42233 RepID=UPI001951D3A0|nr:DsbA family oxidoreductase [Spirilliplanes yamanashiensis]MDP9814978.1 putative DsbA family dithiol-disulfide isomerase [Spirilliplanes yamanashiensis]
MEIEIWTDVVCPWCYIGKRRMDSAVAAYPGDVTVTYRAYQLDPTPVREPQPLVDALAAKFGGPEQVTAMTSRVTDIAAADGLRLDFSRAVAANTFDTHRLIRWAGSHGRQAELLEAAHRAHFTDGVDLNSHDALAGLAAEMGLDAASARAYLASSDGADEVRAEFAAARELGVSSVPTFVLAGKYAVVGAQDSATLLAALEQVARREAAAA